MRVIYVASTQNKLPGYSTVNLAAIEGGASVGNHHQNLHAIDRYTHKHNTYTENVGRNQQLLHYLLVLARDKFSTPNPRARNIHTHTLYTIYIKYIVKRATRKNNS